MLQLWYTISIKTQYNEAAYIYFIFSYASAIEGLTFSTSSTVLTVLSVVDSFLLFLNEIVKESFLGCISRNVRNVSDLAYVILCGLTSSITLSRFFTKFLKSSSSVFVS